MSDPMSTAELVGVIAGSQVLSQTVSNLLARKATMFTASTEAYKALAQRVTALEVRLGVAESERDHARGILRLALDYIRLVLVWRDSDRRDPMPKPSRDLSVHL